MNYNGAMSRSFFTVIFLVIAILIVAFFKIMYDSYRIAFWLVIALLIIAPVGYFFRARIMQALRHMRNRSKRKPPV
jgi:CBS domain containing-hemolysin-like protein